MDNGNSLPLVIRVGATVQLVMGKLKSLNRDIGDALLLHNIYENYPGRTTDKFIGKNQKASLQKVEKEVKNINETISFCNTGIKILEQEYKIKKLDHKKIRDLLKERLRALHNESVPRKLGNESFKLKLEREISKTILSIKNLYEFLDKELEFPLMDKLRNPYESGVTEAINIYSIGHYRTSIFVIGRT
ncbi:MAG TPA: hypothetical protein ENI23_15875, partial [bacterium]|nr:hypothetical protein [bacterium]